MDVVTAVRINITNNRRRSDAGALIPVAPNAEERNMGCRPLDR
jgi:hypothetical protein